MAQPTAPVEKFPAATAAAGCASSLRPAAVAASADGRNARAAGPLRRWARGTASAPPVAGVPSDDPRAFGSYLVATGALTPVQLRAALAYQRSRNLRIGSAAVALGFISEPKLLRTAQSFRRLLRRARQGA